MNCGHVVRELPKTTISILIPRHPCCKSSDCNSSLYWLLSNYDNKALVRLMQVLTSLGFLVAYKVHISKCAKNNLAMTRFSIMIGQIVSRAIMIETLNSQLTVQGGAFQGNVAQGTVGMEKIYIHRTVDCPCLWIFPTSPPWQSRNVYLIFPRRSWLFSTTIERSGWIRLGIRGVPLLERPGMKLRYCTILSRGMRRRKLKRNRCVDICLNITSIAHFQKGYTGMVSSIWQETRSGWEIQVRQTMELPPGGRKR